jgi:hypothetical protein
VVRRPGHRGGRLRPRLLGGRGIGAAAMVSRRRVGCDGDRGRGMR